MIMLRNSTGSSTMLTEFLNAHTDDASFFFSSPTVTLLTQGIAAEFSQQVRFSELDTHISQLLESAKEEGNENPIAVGVIPFSEHNPVHFIVPERLITTSPIRPDKVSDVDGLTDCHPSSIQPIPDPSDYMRSVEQAVRSCCREDVELDKVVLSRTMQVETEEDIDRARFLKTLLKQNPGGYTFSTRIGGNHSDAYLMGSSPELLVSRKGPHVCSNPLAGSRRRSDNESMNQQQGELMMESSKDLHEHAVVVDAVEKALQPWCHNLYVPMVPSVIETKAMLHLSTRIEGMVSDANTSVLKLASALHPTPAVCGYPTAQAYDFISNVEPFDRGYFTGLVGWVDARGNGEWVVVIRCAEVEKKRLRVYAGAGIVAGSEPQSELEETGNKMRTVLNALGIEIRENMEVVQ
ncbi:isochorismate synthase [Vibrio hyugaensis]|uniref:isochorismate synthase n=1 Tax=Vibrio hyugaensis TaxID=1534743 RepID=UPI0006938469|nr:isochorismate synthase [Vibrio hyugaensis]